MLSWFRPRWEAVVALALLALSVGVFIKLALYIDRPLVDDALISIAYARSFVDGDGVRPTPYSQIAEGYSNPTWTFVLGVFERLGFNSMWPAKTLGMLLAALSLPLVFVWGPASQRRKIQVEDALGPLFACTNATLAYWSLGGLETGILVFLVALLGALVFAPRTRNNAIALGMTAAALALTRPEGAMYVAAVGLPSLIGWAVKRRLRPTKNDLIVIGACLLPLALYIVFRRIYFGSWLPNTYYAKHAWHLGAPDPKAVAVDHVRSYVTTASLTFIASAVGVVVSIAGGLNIAKSSAAAALVALSMCFFAWYANADWMKEWRFLAPAIPFVTYPIGAGVTALRKLLGRPLVAKRVPLRVGLYGVVCAAAAFALFSTSKQHHARWSEVKAQGGDTPREAADRYGYGQDLMEMIAPLQMSHPLIAGPDMGWTSVGLRHAELADLAGLTDVTVARHYGNPNAIRDYLKNEGLPTILMVWGPSNYLWSMPDVLGHYRSGKYSSYKIYAKASASSDDRCPTGKATAMQDSKEQMVANILGDLRAPDPVRALALWRCYFTYRKDADLPTTKQRAEIALTAKSMAREAEKEGQLERALRDYSLCAVIGSSSYAPSVSCRMQAERIRAKLFPRAPKR